MFLFTAICLANVFHTLTSVYSGARFAVPVSQLAELCFRDGVVCYLTKGLCVICVHCESKNWTLFHLSITLANTARFLANRLSI